MPKNELLDVIRSVYPDKRHVPPEVAARLAEHLGEEDLTARELEVLRLIRDGFRNKQIADELAIAETTVNFHIKHLVDKLKGQRSDACSDNRNQTRFTSGLNPFKKIILRRRCG
jgi:DNA-binding NarL/FixJ family response regulator